MPFWSKRKPSVADQTAEYMRRTRRRIDLAAQIMARLEHMIRRGDPRREQYLDCYERLRKLADEQRAEGVPLPDMAPHRDINYRLIDLEARKVEDILATGGENVEALSAEEAGLEREAEEEARASRQRTQDIATAYGIDPPDFSKR